MRSTGLSPFERVDFPQNVDGSQRSVGDRAAQLRSEPQYLPIWLAFYCLSRADSNSEKIATAVLHVSQSQTCQLDKFAASFFHIPHSCPRDARSASDYRSARFEVFTRFYTSAKSLQRAHDRKDAMLFGQSGFCLEVVTFLRMRLCSASNSRFTSFCRMANSAQCFLDFRRETMPDTANRMLPRYAPATSVAAILDGATKTLKANRASSVHPNMAVNRLEKIASATGNKVAASATPIGIFETSAAP